MNPQVLELFPRYKKKSATWFQTTLPRGILRVHRRRCVQNINVGSDEPCTHTRSSQMVTGSSRFFPQLHPQLWHVVGCWIMTIFLFCNHGAWNWADFHGRPICGHSPWVRWEWCALKRAKWLKSVLFKIIWKRSPCSKSCFYINFFKTKLCKEWVFEAVYWFIVVLLKFDWFLYNF